MRSRMRPNITDVLFRVFFSLLFRTYLTCRKFVILSCTYRMGSVQMAAQSTRHEVPVLLTVLVN